MPKNTSQTGFGILAAVIMMTALSLICAAVMHAVASGQVTRVNHLVREQAFYNVQAGMEYALKQIASGKNPDGIQKNFSHGTFFISYNPQTGAGSVSADVPGFFAAASRSYTLQFPLVSTQADCLRVNIDDAHLNGNATRLQGLRMTNTCAQDIGIDAMKVAWVPSGREGMDRIRFQNTDVYRHPAVASGSLVDIGQDRQNPLWMIPASQSHDLTSLHFTSNMLLKNFTLDFVMQDGSSKNVFVQFVADNQAACLKVDLSRFRVSGPGERDLKGVVLKNQCAGLFLKLDRMQLVWEPQTPARRLQAIRLDHRHVWRGSARSAQTLDLADLAVSVFGPDEEREQTRLRFDDDMRSFRFTITYIMDDHSSQQIVYPLSP